MRSRRVAMHLRSNAAAALVLTGLVLGSASSAAPGPAGCGTGSWIAGTVDICDGRLVYRDYNYADIAEIRLLVSGPSVLVSFELNALFEDGSTAVALAIDTDDNPATGGGT